jgi:hypothetical protein
MMKIQNLIIPCLALKEHLKETARVVCILGIPSSRNLVFTIGGVIYVVRYSAMFEPRLLLARYHPNLSGL